MQKTILITIVLFVSLTTVKAQTSIDSVKATIDNLFTAMKSSDAQLLKSCFADSAILQTIARDKSGNAIIKNQIVADFAKLIGTMPKDAADERITYDMVKVDGQLAIAWTPYTFYLNGQFSHCGVNSFQLIRFNSGWKIQYLIDTRRKQGCE